MNDLNLNQYADVILNSTTYLYRRSSLPDSPIAYYKKEQSDTHT